MTVAYRLREWPDLRELGALLAVSWGGGLAAGKQWRAILARSLTWVTAHDGAQLVGFVNVAWDGGKHAFLLDTTVHPDWQRQGIGVKLVQEAAEAAAQAGAEWLHVDYEPHLEAFYKACGFRKTEAGLLQLSEFSPEQQEMLS